MKTATIRDISDQFAEISRWIDEGESVEITRDGKPFAHLTPAVVPESSESMQKVKWPDFRARMRTYMDHPLPDGTSDSIIDYDRGDR